MRNALGLIALALVPLLTAPGAALACACGCGIFDLGDGTMQPNDSGSGLTVWFRYSYLDQNQNREGSSRAPAADNADKDLRTSFYTVGAQYLINRSWSVMAELPFYNRAFTTTDDGTVFGPPGSIYTAHIADIGDLQLSATYTGFAPDLSSGLTFGVKLPTGDDTGPVGPLGGAEFDRDSLPGTGSTDLLIGGYHAGKFTPAGPLSYFLQARYEFAVATHDGYRPGNELNAAAGLTYNLGAAGPIQKVAPSLQLIDSFREHDSGPNADPANTGYERVLIAPGVNVRLSRRLDLYGDVELPIYQDFNAAPRTPGEDSGQLAAAIQFKMQVNYTF